MRQAFCLIKSKEHTKEKGLKKIIPIRAAMNMGLPVKLKQEFKEIVPMQRPIVSNQEIPNLNWIAGFTSGKDVFLLISIFLKKENLVKLLS